MKKIFLLLFATVSLFGCSQVQANIFNNGNRKIIMGKLFKIDISNDGKERQFPFVYKFGNNIFTSYMQHHDAVLAEAEDALIISRDNGKTWGEKIINPDFYFSSMFEKEGILYGVVYPTYPKSFTREKMIYWTSIDMGKSWKRQVGIVHAPRDHLFVGSRGIWGSMLFHRGMKVMKDGSVQGIMYGHFYNEKKFTVALVRTDDNGKNWEIGAIVASTPNTDTTQKIPGYTEPTFVKTRDGSMLCVMRINSYLPLVQSRSHDNGATWSNPELLPGLTATASESVDPQLLLLKNGVLALTYGRPNDKMAFAADGCGYHWDTSMNTYQGETTGYTGIVEIAPDKILLVADQGRTGAKQMAIWGREIEVKIKPKSIQK